MELIRTGAQDGHLDSHTAPELCRAGASDLGIGTLPPIPVPVPNKPLEVSVAVKQQNIGAVQ